MNDDLFRRDFGGPEQPEHDNLFLWTILILLLIGLALACWLGSYYIFGHPEKPDSYAILVKLHKLEPPKRFELTHAPAGEFLTPQKVFERYGAMSRFDLEHENEAMLRDYINNYQTTKRLVPYITGRYSIMDSYELKPADFFGSGVVALAQSVDFPQIVIEHVYTAPTQTVPVLDQMLATGLDIKLEKTMDLSAVIQVSRLPDGRLQLTVVPLLYGSYALKQGNGNFSLEPPPQLNPAGGLPILRGQLLKDGLKTYADFVKKRGGPRLATGDGEPVAPVAQSAAQTTIVRVEESPTPAPETTKPSTSVATAAAAPAVKIVVAAKPTPGEPPETAATVGTAAAGVEAASTPVYPPAATAARPTPKVASNTASGVKASVTPAPAVTPHPTPAATSLAGSEATPAVTPATVAAAASPKLQPFLLLSSPTPAIATNTGASWRVYAPGQMPRGRLVTMGEASDLANRGTGGERLYLQGSFVVTAKGENRAVLRSNSTLGNALATVTKAPSARIIVEFPAGSQPPRERSTLTRDESRPFEVRDVRRGPDGQINIYVREVTSEP